MTPEQYARLHPSVRAVFTPLPPLDRDLTDEEWDAIFPNRRKVLPQLVRDMTRPCEEEYHADSA